MMHRKIRADNNSVGFKVQSEFTEARQVSDPLLHNVKNYKQDNAAKDVYMCAKAISRIKFDAKINDGVLEDASKVEMDDKELLREKRESASAIGGKVREVLRQIHASSKRSSSGPSDSVSSKNKKTESQDYLTSGSSRKKAPSKSLAGLRLKVSTLGKSEDDNKLYGSGTPSPYIGDRVKTGSHKSTNLGKTSDNSNQLELECVKKRLLEEEHKNTELREKIENLERNVLHMERVEETLKKEKSSIEAELGEKIKKKLTTKQENAELVKENKKQEGDLRKQELLVKQLKRRPIDKSVTHTEEKKNLEEKLEKLLVKNIGNLKKKLKNAQIRNAELSTVLGAAEEYHPTPIGSEIPQTLTLAQMQTALADVQKRISSIERFNEQHFTIEKTRGKVKSKKTSNET